MREWYDHHGIAWDVLKKYIPSITEEDSAILINAIADAVIDKIQDIENNQHD